MPSLSSPVCCDCFNVLSAKLSGANTDNKESSWHASKQIILAEHRKYFKIVVLEFFNVVDTMYRMYTEIPSLKGI